MSTMTGTAVISRAATILLDAGNTRWTAPEMLGWLNDGRREMAVLRPDLYAVRQVVTLAAGAVQALPAGGSRLFDVLGNVASDGTTRTGAVSIAEREMLDALNPSWYATKSGPAVHFTYDERTPKQYLVYPPAATGAKLEIEFGQDPADLADANTALTNEGAYAVALIDYLVSRAMDKDSEDAANAARAGAHYQRFIALITGGVQVSGVTTPNSANVGGASARAAGG